MILKTEEIERRLRSPNNLIEKLRSGLKSVEIEYTPPEILPLTKKTKLVGDTKKVPDCVRDLIAATLATSDETQKEIAEQFGLSQNTVSLFNRGLVGYRKDERVKEVIDAVQEKKKEKRSLKSLQGF